MALEPRVLLSARHDPFGAGTFPAVGVGCRPDGVSAPPLDPGASNVPAAGPAIPAEDSPLSAVPLLHSRPAATVKLYLDFDGDVPTASWGGYSVPATPAYDTDGNAAAFSDTELSAVRQMWARVAEKYAPFNIDVTTAAPPALTNKVAFRIVVGGDGAWYGGGGGVTWANSFSNFQPNTGYVFSKNLANGTFEFVAEAAAHEAGHGFGLQHQSIYNGTTIANEYNPGNSLVAPVMGSSYYAARGVWWLGPNNLSSTTIQDDLSVLNNAANAFRYAGDDYGSTAATAGALTATGGTLAAAGVIEQAADLDYFSFTAATAGQASFTANVGSYVRAETGSSAGATLDLALELRDAGGNLIASADTSALGETFTANLPVAGTYYLVVRSHGAYGDLGTYVVDGTFQPAPVVSTPTNVVGQRGQFVSVPIAVDNAAGIRSFNLSLVYDTTLVDLATADVTAGALLPPGWSLTVTVDDAAGRVTLSGSSPTPLSGGSGELVRVRFSVPATAPAGATVLRLTGALNGGSLATTATDGRLTVPIAVTLTGFPATSPEGTAITGSASTFGASGAIAYAWTVTRDGAPYLTGSAGTLAFVPELAGAYAVTLAVTDQGGNVGTATAVTTVTFVSFRVTALTPTANGFDVRFVRPARPELLNLYDGPDAAVDLPDMTLVGQSGGAVGGSLVWDAAAGTARFVAASGLLAPDTYSLTLSARADAWVSARGEALDGNADGTPGDDYTATFIVPPPTATPPRALSLPSVARGPGQPVDSPVPGGGGLPVRIDNAAGLTAVAFDLAFDPMLLTVRGITGGAALPAGWTATLTALAAGRVRVALTGGTPLAAGPLTLASLTADVPAAAPYGAGHVLRVENVSLDGGAVAGVGAGAVHAVVFAGDATGDRTYGALDAAYIARAALGRDAGFDSAAWLAPRILADVTGDGTLSTYDASVVARKAVGLPQPEIPDLPPGSGGGGAAHDGPAPLAISVPSLTARPGAFVTVPVAVSGDIAGAMAGDLTIAYDPRLGLTDADVVAAGLTRGWFAVASADPTTGVARAAVFSADPIAGQPGGGTLLELRFSVPTTLAHGSVAPVSATASLDEGRIATTAQAGAVTVDAVRPVASGGGLVLDAGAPRLVVQFTEGVGPSLAPDDFRIVDRDTGTVMSPELLRVTYDPLTNRADVTYAGAGNVFPDGNYRVVLSAGAVSDLAGNATDADLTADFFLLAGDADGDRTVGLNDLVSLSNHFGSQTGQTWADGDFDGNGEVGLNDLVILSNRYGSELAPPDAPALPAADYSADRAAADLPASREELDRSGGVGNVDNLVEPARDEPDPPAGAPAAQDTSPASASDIALVTAPPARPDPPPAPRVSSTAVHDVQPPAPRPVALQQGGALRRATPAPPEIERPADDARRAPAAHFHALAVVRPRAGHSTAVESPPPRRATPNFGVTTPPRPPAPLVELRASPPRSWSTLAVGDEVLLDEKPVTLAQRQGVYSVVRIARRGPNRHC